VTTQVMEVTRLFPKKATAGSVISIFGANFGTKPDTVWFNDTAHRVTVQPGEPENWTDTRIDVAVPNLQEGTYIVKVAVGGALTEQEKPEADLTVIKQDTSKTANQTSGPR